MRYVLLIRNEHPAAAQEMLMSGGEGAATLVGAIEEDFGGSVSQFLAVTGEYDAIVVCELPSHAAALAVALSAHASGRSVQALPAATADELEEARVLAADVARRQAERLLARAQEAGEAEPPPDAEG